MHCLSPLLDARRGGQSRWAAFLSKSKKSKLPMSPLGDAELQTGGEQSQDA